MDRQAHQLTTFTFVFLVLYAPIETWYSMPRIWDPFYLVDAIGIVLLIAGTLLCRRTALVRHLGILIAGYAWTGANFWRAFFDRVSDVRDGATLDYGMAELCLTLCVLAAAIGGLVWSLAVNVRARAAELARSASSSESCRIKVLEGSALSPSASARR